MISWQICRTVNFCTYYRVKAMLCNCIVCTYFRFTTLTSIKFKNIITLSIYPFISLIDLSISNNRIYLVKSNWKALRVIASRRRRGESICPLAKIYFVVDFSNNYQFLSNLVLLTFSFQKERCSKYTPSSGDPFSWLLISLWERKTIQCPSLISIAS